MTDLTLTAELDALTPVELVNGRWYKRDDKLAFSNGVNGKVRTSIWLAHRARNLGHNGLVYGGSVHAPALGRVASAAAFTGMDCYLVIGSEKRTAIKHPTVRVAVDAGAMLLRSKVAYNPALQAMAKRVAEESDGWIFQVPYGVSTGPSWAGRFLEVDAPQVDNLPDEIETLVVPFGSGNSAAAVLYGLTTRKMPLLLDRVVLVGVGPDRSSWLYERLKPLGVDIYDGKVPITFEPLHPHFAQYEDRMPETEDGIHFHPTYEGKIIRYLNTTKPFWWTRDDSVCVWVVGGPLP